MFTKEKLVGDLRTLKDVPLYFCVYGGLINSKNIYKWRVYVDGPPYSPYFQGRFYIDLVFDKEHPEKLPKIQFLTRIIHINIWDGLLRSEALSGDVHSVMKLLLSIRDLLRFPNTSSGMIADWACYYKSRIARRKYKKDIVRSVRSFAARSLKQPFEFPCADYSLRV